MKHTHDTKYKLCGPHSSTLLLIDSKYLPQLSINTDHNKRREERLFTPHKTPNWSENVGRDIGRSLNTPKYIGRGGDKKHQWPNTPNWYVVGGRGGGSYCKIKYTYFIASKYDSPTPSVLKLLPSYSSTIIELPELWKSLPLNMTQSQEYQLQHQSQKDQHDQRQHLPDEWNPLL